MRPDKAYLQSKSAELLTCPCGKAGIEFFVELGEQLSRAVKWHPWIIVGGEMGTEGEPLPRPHTPSRVLYLPCGTHRRNLSPGDMQVLALVTGAIRR